MRNLRPRTGDRYLLRPRLIRLLPSEPGWVLWLRAPYGFGKSILSAQWAEALESSGHRVLWQVPGGQPLHSLLVEQLELPGDAPWGLIRERLSEVPTLLVVEDLSGQEGAELDALLQPPLGLILLASRSALAVPALPKWRAAGRLLELGAAELAFTPEEAGLLFGGEAQGRAAWERTGGWPLALHLLSRSPELADTEAILTGWRDGVSPEAWREAQFLANLDYLPSAAATGATLELDASGLLQRLEGGYRLHPFLRSSLLEADPSPVREAAAQEARRLPPSLRAEAYCSAGSAAQLAELLEAAWLDEDPLADPQRFLRWEAAAALPRSPLRQLRRAIALLRSGQLQLGTDQLRELLSGGEAPPALRLEAYGHIAFQLAGHRQAEALAAAEAGLTLLTQVDAPLAGAFLNDVARVYFEGGDLDRAGELVRRALELLPQGSGERASALDNLGRIRFEQSGDLSGWVALKEEALPDLERGLPHNLAQAHRELAELHWLLAERGRALAHLDLAVKESRRAPLEALAAEGLGAQLRGSSQAFAPLVARSEHWSSAELTGQLRVGWAKVLLGSGQLAEARAVLSGTQGLSADLLRCLASQPRAQLRDLPAKPLSRLEQLEWQATRYRLGRRARDLQELLALTASGAKVLPALIPIRELPRNRPELSDAYPAEEVLGAGWKEAAQRHRSEIPPLRVRLLGEIAVHRGEQPLALRGKPLQLLVLALLGLSRDQIAEALWPEQDPERSHNTLGVQLHRLRKQAGLFAQGELVGSALLRSQVDSDLGELERALLSEDAERCYTLYRGPLAPGIDLPAVDQAREELQRQVVSLLTRSSAGNSPELAKRWLERALSLDPLNESALQELLRLLLFLGERAEAVRRYADFAAQLREETSLEPLPETNKLLSDLGRRGKLPR